MANNSSIEYDLWTHPVSIGIRSLFYVVTPGESSFEKVEDVPNYVAKATPYFFLLMGIEFLINFVKGEHDKKPRWNDLFSSVTCGIFSQLPLLFMRSIEFTAYLWMHRHFKLFELPWEHPATWIIALFGVDLGYYWVHRFAHEVNLFWSAHQVHHSSEDYNLSTALRQSVMQRYNSWMVYLPLALFIPPTQFLVHIQFNLLYQFYIHTEIVHKLGPLEWILNTPSHHRVHHGRNRYCIDKNYAGVFIIWDRMFGTFAEERDDQEIAYGLVHPLRCWDIHYTQFFLYRYLFRRVKRTKGWKNKLSVLFKGPGWAPGKPRLGVPEDIPDIRTKQKKYDKTVSFLMTLYVYLHFFVAIAAHDTLNQFAKGMSPMSVFSVTLFILWTLTNIGFFFEHRHYAPVSELARCCAYLIADGITCYGGVCAAVMYVPRVIYVLSTSIWLVQCTRQAKVKAE